LRRAAVYWSSFELLLDRAQPPHRVEYLAAVSEAAPNITFYAGDSGWDPAGRFRGRDLIRLDFPAPAYPLRQRIWERYLPGEACFANPVPDRGVLAETLANAFQFTEGQVLDAVSTARTLAARRDPQQPQFTPQDFHEACRRHSSRTLSAFATRIEP